LLSSQVFILPLPILIAARNESRNIAATLQALPRDAEPIVLANGCTDDTAEIASSYGATVLSFEEQGKLPALQAGIEHLGRRALAPFITLDADTRPLIKNKWLDQMQLAREAFGPKQPVCIVGPAVYTEMDLIAGSWRNVGHWRNQIKTRDEPNAGFFSGRNMLLHFTDNDSLDEALALPHIWPGEDVALKDVVVNHGGQARKLLDPRAIVLTSGERYPGLVARLKQGKQKCTEWCWQSYLREAPADAITYDDFTKSGQRASGAALLH
jgi:glycosyltransferase involved in cell wall biosynthesis